MQARLSALSLLLNFLLAGLSEAAIRTTYSRQKGLRRDSKIVIIDTDPGLDDMFAIFAVLAERRIQVAAITTVFGSAPVKQTTINLMRILRAANRLDIPVYPGSSRNLTGDVPEHTIYGGDGLGDRPDDLAAPLVPSSEHAAQAIVRLVRVYPKRISVVALGSLTNIALAYLIEPNLFNMIKELIIMGGTYRSIGNISPYAEFNFFSDPDAADLVMRHATAPTTLVPWDFVLDHSIPENAAAQYLSVISTRTLFVNHVRSHLVGSSTETDFVCAAGQAVVLWLRPDLVSAYVTAVVSVERHNATTRGMTYVRVDPKGHVKIPVRSDAAVIHQLLFSALLK